MKLTNEQLKEQALSAINELFEDTSVSTETAIDNLLELQSEIDTLVDTLQNQD